MASNQNRDRLIKTFMARTNTGRRKQRGPLDQGYATSPGGKAGYRPRKQGTVASFKPNKQARY